MKLVVSYRGNQKKAIIDGKTYGFVIKLIDF